MKRILRNTMLLSLLSTAVMACGGGDDEITEETGNGGNGGNKVERPEPFVAHITPIEQLNQGQTAINSHADVTSRSSLMMNYRMLVSPQNTDIGATYPQYPRVKKMKNGNYILFFHNGWSGGNIGRSCDYATSTDMKKWVHQGKIFKDYEMVDSEGNKNIHCYANPDGLVLANGDVLAVASYRVNSNHQKLTQDAGVELRRSRDNGVTWSEPIQIYQGLTWEPYLLELPSGELHCYFTDSNRTGQEGRGTDTGTAMVVSTDGGKTWKPDFGSLPYYVLRMRWEKDGIVGYNHQMPSVVCLNEGKGLAAAVETNNLGKYYISLCYSDKNDWEHLTPEQDGPADSDNLKFSGAAPYLGQFPSGETVLSYNSSGKYNLRIGDATARNFGDAYQPLSCSWWGSLQVIDAHRMIGTVPRTKEGPVQIAQFVLNHRIGAVKREVTVDGNNSEWADTDHALFVGSQSQAQGTLRCSYDDDNVYFLLEVLDRNALVSDYASIYISPANNSKLAKGACCIQLGMNGLKSCSTYDTSWKESPMNVRVKTYVCNDTNESQIDSYGYIAEISVPRSELTIASGEILVNFSITKRNLEDAICNVASASTARWIPVNGL